MFEVMKIKTISILLSIFSLINGDSTIFCELQKTKKQEDIFQEIFAYKCLNKNIFDLEDDKIGRQIKLKCYDHDIDLESLPYQSIKNLPFTLQYDIIVLEHCSLILSTKSSMQKYLLINNDFSKNITKVTFKEDPGPSSNEKGAAIELPNELHKIFPKVEQLTILHYNHLIVKPENQTWPPNLQKLKLIYLEKDQILPKFVNSNIVELVLEKSQISNISNIKYLNKLEVLTLYENNDMRNLPINVLRNLKSLKQLTISRLHQLRQFDLRIIEGLKNLTYLKIEDTSLSKRKFNFALPKLEEIILIKTMK